MNKITLDLPGEKPISFTGVPVAESEDKGGESCKFEVYKTAYNNYICICYHRIFSMRSGKYLPQRTYYNVCKTKDKIVDFFGQSDAAKEIYAQLDINNNTYIN